MIGRLPITLLLSLIFGLGQLLVGGWLAWYTLTPARRSQWRLTVFLFVGLWFVVSGVIELFVSGMEASRALVGTPAEPTFALLRGRADVVLFVASALLGVGALTYPFLVRWRMER